MQNVCDLKQQARRLNGVRPPATGHLVEEILANRTAIALPGSGEIAKRPFFMQNLDAFRLHSADRPIINGRQ